MGKLVQRLRSRNGINIKHRTFRGANHIFENHLEPMAEAVGSYIDSRVAAA